jgi:zinc transporter ZupT
MCRSSIPQINISMADIENLLASGSTATAEANQRGVWAWKDRSVLTANDPNAGAADGVATADCELRRRVRFLWWCTLLELVAVVGFVLLLAVKPSTAGQAVYVTAVSVGCTGMVVAAFLGSYLVHLWNSVIEGKRDDQRNIDWWMHFFGVN